MHDTNNANELCAIITNVIALTESDDFCDMIQASPFSNTAKFQHLIENILYCGNAYSFTICVLDTAIDIDHFVSEVRKLMTERFVLDSNCSYVNDELLSFDLLFSLAE